MFIPLKDRKGKLPYRRALRCRFLAYSYTTTLVPTYIVTPWFDNGTYGGSRISKDIIFDESCVFVKYIDNSPTDEEFAALPHRIENLHPEPAAVVKKVKFAEYEQYNTDVLPTPAGLPVAESIGILPSPPLHINDPQEYKDIQADKPDTHKEHFPLVVSDTSEYVQEVDEYGTPIYRNTITGEHSTVPVVDITVLNYHQFMATFLMAIASAAQKAFTMAIMQTIWPLSYRKN